MKICEIFANFNKKNILIWFYIKYFCTDMTGLEIKNEEKEEKMSPSGQEFPLLGLKTSVNLLELKEKVKENHDWTYIWKDKTWKSYKSLFIDGKRTGEKPAKYVTVYDLKWKKQLRAREREQEHIPPKKTQTQEDSELIKYLKEKNIIPDIENSIVYYVPVEDGTWKIVKYQVIYIPKNSTSEVIQLPIRDITGKLVRYQTIVRNIPLERPAVDPIDLVCLGWGVRMSFAKWLTTLAPKAGINLSKTAVNQMSQWALFFNILWQEISKEAVTQAAGAALNYANEKIEESAM